MAQSAAQYARPGPAAYGYGPGGVPGGGGPPPGQPQAGAGYPPQRFYTPGEFAAAPGPAQNWI